ncbi:MAG: HEAT repeat domain-containing protein [Planctomycetota bacterium]|jgi:HEAT repeat protein
MVLVLLLGACLAGLAQQQDVGDLVEQIRNGDVAEREAAREKLETVPDEDLDLLRPYWNDEDPEVRVSVQRVLMKRSWFVVSALGGDDEALAARAAFALQISVPLRTGWPSSLDLIPRRPCRFRELSEDFHAAGVPLLLWPRGTTVADPDKLYEGSYESILEAFCKDRGWESRCSKHYIVVFPKEYAGEIDRDFPSALLVRYLMEEEAPSSLSFGLAMRLGDELEGALIRHVGETTGFWKHSADILMHRAARGRLKGELTDEAVRAISKKLEDPSWEVRTTAAEALICMKRLPPEALEHKDPWVRYLGAAVAERAGVCNAALYPLLEDKHRDIRRAAVFALVRGDSPKEKDWGRILSAAMTIAGEDTDCIIRMLRGMKEDAEVGSAAARLLGGESSDIAFRVLSVFRQKEVVEAVCAAAEKEKRSAVLDRYVRLLAWYLETEGRPAVLRTLVSLLAARSERVGRRAALILGEQKEESVRDGIIALLDHEDRAVRLRVLEALYSWARYNAKGRAGGACIAAVAERARKESDAEVRIVAMELASVLRVGWKSLPGEPDAIVLEELRYSARDTMKPKKDDAVETVIPRPDLPETE